MASFVKMMPRSIRLHYCSWKGKISLVFLQGQSALMKLVKPRKFKKPRLYFFSTMCGGHPEATLFSAYQRVFEDGRGGWACRWCCLASPCSPLPISASLALQAGKGPLSQVCRPSLCPPFHFIVLRQGSLSLRLALNPWPCCLSLLSAATAVVQCLVQTLPWVHLCFFGWLV